MNDDIKTGTLLPRHAEDAMVHPPNDWPEEVIPGHYRRIAQDPHACLAMAAEELDSAATGDVKSKDAAVRVANVWIRLAEASVKINGSK